MNMILAWSVWFIGWMVAFAGLETYAISTGRAILQIRFQFHALSFHFFDPF